MKFLSFLLFPGGAYCGEEAYRCLAEMSFNLSTGDEAQVVVMACCVAQKQAIPSLLQLIEQAFSKHLRSEESLGVLAWTSWCRKMIEADTVSLQGVAPDVVLEDVRRHLQISLKPEDIIFVMGLYDDYLKYRQSLV